MTDGQPDTTNEAPDYDPAASPPGLAFRVALPNFEGPLDMLLHLIREHKVDIFDIPISLITEKYLEQVEKMRELNLDIAGEFLVMVSTLMHIKSRLLLPRQELQTAELSELATEEQGDPRAELVRRLLEYQKYKESAEQLLRQDILDRDVFPRRVAVEATPIPDEEVGLVDMSVYKLIEALDLVLDKLVPKHQHQVVRERVRLSDAIKAIATRLRARAAAGEALTFFGVFEGQSTRHEIIITFLAILEMCRLKLIRVQQPEEQGDIVLSEKDNALDQLNEVEAKEQDDYR